MLPDRFLLIEADLSSSSPLNPECLHPDVLFCVLQWWSGQSGADMTGAGSGETLHSAVILSSRFHVFQMELVVCQMLRCRQHEQCEPPAVLHPYVHTLDTSILNNLTPWLCVISCLLRRPGPTWRGRCRGGGEVSYLPGPPVWRRARHAWQLLPHLLPKMPPHMGRGEWRGGEQQWILIGPLW